VCLLFLVLGSRTGSVLADIYYDSDSGPLQGQVIPGTQGITPGPGIDLSGWNTPGHQLEYADLRFNLAGATFANSDLRYAMFQNTTLTNANFTNADLTSASVGGANFSGAIVTGAKFFNFTNLTANQLYSTASYASGNLAGIAFEANDLSGWNFASQNLTKADFFGSNLTDTNFTGAVVNGAALDSTNFTAGQLYSTASFASGDLTGVGFGSNLSGWNFANQNLTSASFFSFSASNSFGSNLTGATFTGAIVKGAVFDLTNLTANQLYSTASFANGDLTGISLGGDDVTGWNFANQNLTQAKFNSAILTNVNLSNLNLSDASFYSSLMTNANLVNANLTNAFLDQAVLTNADLANATLTNAFLGNADFTGTDLRSATGWSPAATTVTHNTIRPDGSIQGLALMAGEKLIVRNNPIPIAVATSATLDNAATLEFLLDANWTSPIGFSAGLNPSLAGTLDLEIASGVDPSTLVGDSFQLFNWGGPLPARDQFSMITTEPGLNWDLSSLYSAGTVTLMAVPEPSALLLASFGLAATAAFASRRALRQRLRLALAHGLN
jgi:uncharacterized protein YjbI with pentapeptide repeats